MSEKQIQVYEPTINSPVLMNLEEVREIVSENLDGVTPEFTRVKFPSGGGLAFEVPGDGDDPDVVRELTGVVLDSYAVNAYWAQKFEGENNPPDCSSMDGKVGVAPEGSRVPWAGGCQECATCPMNQWGSAPDGAGKACKNMRRVYLLREGEIFPILITIPPTSVKAWNTYVVNLTSKLKTLQSVVTKIRLKKTTNKGGIEYSEGVFSKAKDLTKEEAATMKQYANGLKAVMRQVSIETVEAHVVEETSPASNQGVVDISDPADDIA